MNFCVYNFVVSQGLLCIHYIIANEIPLYLCQHIGLLLQLKKDDRKIHASKSENYSQIEQKATCVKDLKLTDVPKTKAVELNKKTCQRFDPTCNIIFL